MSNKDNEFAYTRNDIHKAVYDALVQLDTDADDKQRADLIIETLAKMYNEPTGFKSKAQGYRMVVDKENEGFQCSYQGHQAGFISFQQLNDFTLQKLRTYADGHDMGDMDLGSLQPVGNLSRQDIQATAGGLPRGTSDK